MKLTCDRSEFSKAAQVAAGVAPQRSTLPALQNIKLSAEKTKSGGTLTLSATDLEVGVRLRVPLESLDEEGTLVLPAARLSAILRESQAAKATLAADGPLANLTLDRGRYKIVGADAGDFPEFPTVAGTDEFKLPTPDLRDMIQKTRFAASTEVTRYALTGILIDVREKECRLVASDGKRLSLVARKGSGASKPTRSIVPTKALHLLERVLEGEESEVAVRSDPGQIEFSREGVTVVSRLIEGNFPDYETVVPRDMKLSFTLKREELAAAVRQVVPLVTDRARAVRFTFADGALTLFTKSAEVGEASVEMPVDYSGKPFAIVFNPDFVHDFLRAAAEPEITLELKDPSSAGILREGKLYTYVVMPLTVTL